MRILLTNHSLVVHAGTELYVRDVAGALRDRGHTAVCYSSLTGPAGEEIRASGIPVLSCLGDMNTPPEVIHGHHHIQTLAALLAFPGVPAISFCHGITPWQEVPLRHPRVLRYVAVSELTREWVQTSTGAPHERIRVIPNFVDLRRFKPRSGLPVRPQRALVFNNYFTPHNGLNVIQSACQNEGVQLDIAGVAAGRPAGRPERLIGRYDIVFASGRCALEAMAVGAAVIVCSTGGCGPMVNPSNLDWYRSHNFGLHSYQHALDPAYLAGQIRCYDPAGASEVSRRIRACASHERAVDRLVALYAEVAAEWAQSEKPAPETEAAAVSQYLEHWARRFTMSAEGPEVEALRKELNAVYQSATWRWTQSLLRVPLLRPLLNPFIREVALQSARRATAAPAGSDAVTSDGFREK